VNTFVARIYSHEKEKLSGNKVAPIEQLSQVEMLSKASKSNHPSSVAPIRILQTHHDNDLNENNKTRRKESKDDFVRSFNDSNSPRNNISSYSDEKFKGKYESNTNRSISPQLKDSEGRAANKAGHDFQLSHSTDSLPTYTLPAVDHTKGPYLL
jgi:hypothetical protein